MEKVIEAMREAGFELPDFPIADGKVHRFKRNSKDNKKTAWYIGFQNHRPKDGEIFYVFQFGDWRENSENTINTIGDKALDKHEKKLIKDNQDKAAKQREKEKEQIQNECAANSGPIWDKLKEYGTNEYLKRKNIDELYGARIGNARFNEALIDDVVYIPVRDSENKIWGFQKISPQGEKKLSFGVKIKGNFFQFGKPDGGTLFICEGFATAASVHAATQRPTICAFFASNLPDVCRQFASENEVILCGDDDRFNEKNSGREWAEKSPCSKSVFPIFQNLDSKPTDFNDLHCLEGIETVRKQLSNIERGEYVSCLGYRGSKYFFRSSENLQIVSIPRESFAKNSLRDLIQEAYYERNYPDPQGGVDWDWASDDLMKRCRKKGIFDDSRIRGAGVWRDENRFVINLGDSLYFDGQKNSLDALKNSDYIYEQGKRIKPPLKSALTENEGEKLISALSSLLWKTPDAAKILSGWLVVAPFAGVLEWRSHVWLTGPKGSGKSFVMGNLINPMIREWRNYFLGQTTEAGVRQTQKSDARPVVFDEFESDDERGNFRIQSLLELFRQASSESEGFVVKGTPAGTALHYRPRFACIVSSIRVNLMQDADISRFCVIELKDAQIEGNNEQFEKLKRKIAALEDDYAMKLFSRVYSKLDILNENISTFWGVLRKEYTPRIAQQYSSLLAGHYLLTHDNPVNDEKAFTLISEMKLDEARQVSSEADQDECIDYLFRKIIKYKFAESSGNETSIGKFVFEAWKEDTPRTHIVLGMYGMAVDDGHIFISNKHSELKNLFKGTAWANSWAKSLSRIPGSETQIVKRIENKPTRCVKISLVEVFQMGNDGEPMPF